MKKTTNKKPRKILAVFLVFCIIVMWLSSIFIFFLPRKTLTDYVKIDLGQNQLGEVYKGHISCTAEFDEEALRSRYPIIGDWFFESAFTGGWYFFDCVKLTLYVNGQPCDSFATLPPKVTVENLSPDDEIEVKAEWKFTNPIEYCLVVLIYGQGISKLPHTYRTTVRDEIERQDLTLKTAAELDVLGYIEENDLLYSKDNVYGDTLVFLKQFETNMNGYTIKNDNELGCSFVVISPDGYPSSEIMVLVGEGNYSNIGYKKGCKYKVRIDNDTAPYGFVFPGRDFYYTVE